MDHVLTIFTEFSIKSYVYPEIFRAMENQVCEYIAFGGVKSLETYALYTLKYKTIHRDVKYSYYVTYLIQIIFKAILTYLQ